MEHKKQPRLRTFEDVFHRMRWDDQYAEQDLTIGYEDRLLGAMEMTLHDFIPVAEGGDLPMHRIWYVRSGDAVLWDRRRKLDLVFGSGLTAAILSTGNKEISGAETAQRIDRAAANLQKIKEDQQHQLDVQLHAQRHAAARAAGCLPCPTQVVGRCADPAKLEACANLARANLTRQKLISDLFNACDADEDGFLDIDEMHVFALQVGFAGNDAEWVEEFADLCVEYFADTQCGLDYSVFEKLVNDDSDCGCHCTDHELQQIGLSIARENFLNAEPGG